ncbi:hypothetical protein FACS1894191_6000 [Clostridia bacterium]|nr:hypothetical protein FACS1894191_6000 [Clostridia bacterium]
MTKNEKPRVAAVQKSPQDNIWYVLDNAANLFPAISNDRNTNVFRLSCELNESVDRIALQRATDKAMRSFGYFQMIMRRGFFWHYLEHTEQTPVVGPESERPCARIYYADIKKLLFKVTYFGRRINLEVFHAVSDGAGAFELLRAIVCYYITLNHRGDFPDELPMPDIAGPPAHMAEDSFDHHYDPRETQSPFKQRAYTISGTLLPTDSINVISAEMSAKDILALSRANGVTITAYLSALMICSIYDGLVPRRASRRPIGVNIPVDLRGHFKSESARNFFSVIDVSYNFGGGPAVFADVLKSVSGQLAEKLSPELLAKRMNYNMSVQKNVFAGVTPLALKNLILRAAYRKGEASTTCALSNLGRITMPESLAGYVHSFHCLLNPTLPHKLKACICSYGDRFVINMTSCIAETKAQTSFIRHLAAQGVDITITCNGAYENEIL